jgi:DNA-binding Lrp family transcriptional regulator
MILMVSDKNIDLQIVRALRENGRVTVMELAKTIHASRHTITKHMRKLVEDGDLVISGGYDISKLGYKMATVGLEVSKDTSREFLYQFLKSCPRVQSIFRTPEKANIQVGIWGEDDSTIQSCVESFRDLPDVNIVDINYLGTPIYGKILITVGPCDSDEAPCGKVCSECFRYQNSWCYGCPVTTDSKNPLIQ